MTQAAINRRREEFPTLVSGIHLLSHSLGPMPTTAREYMSAYCAAWEQHTNEDAWATAWWELSQDVGDQIAAIIGAESGSIQIQPNASIALATVASCFDFAGGKRKKVVTSALDFPSMEYIWEAQRALGAEIVIVDSADGISLNLEELLAAIDDNTALVAMSHTSFRSSYRVDARAVVERAHQAGALCLLDIYQSAGAMKLEAKDWNVDFLIGGTIKWLCGGPACGYLYVRPDLQKDLRPRLTGWVAHDAPFEFAHVPMRYAKSVRRFAQGTPSIPALYSALGGLKIISEVGIDVISAESQRRTEMMIEFALDRGWQVNTPRAMANRGGSIMIGVPDGPAMVQRLAERKVFVDSRPGVGLRMSPHFFNTDEEVSEAFAILAQLIGR
ncbi:MAG TPA: aminotransferase class V-fold PLP-dependent enzyme [Pyrinomonadaceae bacterium]|nr:aminotransferase class V-fold PLP-dependent enzyme [Pyrinomonadaceae bacterium]